MNFNFEETAGVSQSNTRKILVLEGNKIHEVTFDGCVARDFAGVQDPNKKFKVLDIKFHNNDGYFTHTIWEPRDEDNLDRQGVYGVQPSNVKCMMYLLKHLIDAVNPELSKKIDNKEEKISVSSWNALRAYMEECTKNTIGIKTKIKLIKNNKGESIFPYFLNYSKEGKLYMSTNFIGNNIFFTSKELDRIKKANNSIPTSIKSAETEFEIPLALNDVDNFDVDI